MPKTTAACCTDSTNTSLTSATTTVTPPSVANATPIGHGASPSWPCAEAANNSRCVRSENSIPRAYDVISSTDSPRLSCSVKTAAGPASASVTADGINRATVARNSRLAWRRALTRLNSCTWYFKPPRRNAAPSMNNVFVTIAPAIDALTSMYCPARSAVSAMTSSVRFPSVALRRPPTVSPVLDATDSVA